MPRFRPLDRRRAWLLSMSIVPSLVWVGILGISGPAAGQTAFQAALERERPASDEERNELYRQLRQQAQILEAQAAVVKTVAKLLSDAVVHIEADVTERSLPQFGRRRQIEEAGSGVIVNLGGRHYVLTNRHVVNGAAPSAINIDLVDGRRIHPDKVLTDSNTDVAVLAVSGPDLVAVPIGDSDKLEIGDFVLAVGSPFGLKRTVTYGIISAKGRHDLELGEPGVELQDFLQTDAAINPGNSGGPLVNLRGEVIGINTAIASNSGGSEGVGFAIPINMFMAVARQLIDQGKITRGFLGVTLDRAFGPTSALQVGLPRPLGAKITEITPNSPAALAGLQPGDVIVEVDNVAIEDDSHLVNVINLAPVGKDLNVVVLRNRQPVVVKVRLVDRSGS